MGLINFIKNAGKKLGIGDDEPPSPEALKNELDSYNLGTENVSVEVQGDKAIVKGEVADQSALEKTLLAVGNTLGIAQVDSQLKAPDQKEPVLYTVEKGDSLWKIAEAQYGKGKGAKYTIIFEANKPMLKDPDEIYPGQVLRIPPLD